jgi:hypothetical protein
MSDDNVSNLGYSSIISYVSFCLIFFTLKFAYFAEDNATWIILFLVLSFILQLMNNIAITANANVCGKSEIPFAFYHTIIPWILVFTVTALCLLAFPGWLRVFSNTFGLYAAEAYGLQDVISKIFTNAQRNSVTSNATREVIEINDKGEKVHKSNPDIQLLKAIDNVYTNPTVIINELDPRTVKKSIVTRSMLSGFDEKTQNEFYRKFYDYVDTVPRLNDFEGEEARELIEWDSLSKLSPQFITNPPVQGLIKELYHMALLKDTVGYFFWFLFVGTLSSLISVNSLLTSQCNSTKKTNFDIIFNNVK